MKLPNAAEARVPSLKITDYLLSDTHPAGRHKAAFFLRRGFSATRWRELAEALRRHAEEHDVSKREATPYGTRYVVDGIMHGPAGRSLEVRSVWFIDEGQQIPRFVTAYPL